MASKEEVVQLKKTVQELRRGQLEILIRLENLEDRIGTLEGGEGGGSRSKPKEPEPILTCVQCSAEYKESENAEGSCKFHGGRLQGAGGWTYKFTCCGKSSENYDSARSLPGCTKGKHRSKHHTDYPYAAYIFYMTEQSKKAKEVWLTADIEDHVTERSEWAEVGLSDEGKVFVLVGTSRVECIAYVDFSAEELKQCKDPSFTAVDKSDSVGWAIKVEVHSRDSVANAVIASIKPASSPTPLIKRVELLFEGDTPRPGKVECLSDPNIPKPPSSFTVPENSYEGLMLEAGEDYSKDRKNDYESETTNNCPLQLQQSGHTEVASSTSRMANGKWNNLFTANVKVTNTVQENLAVTDVIGEYMNKEGEWVKCEELWIGREFFRGNYDWFKSTNFSLDSASTGTLIARLAIPCTGDPPSSSYEGRRAHHSLPQPLHLRVTFVDQEKRSASLRFEQGNPPLPLATRESRGNGWAKKAPLEFHLLADDVNKNKRSDAAIYYDENGMLVYRPAPNDQGSQYFYVSSSIAGAAYKAMKAGEREYELTKMKKENHGSTVQIFLVVDLDSGVAYALKVAIVTPTSSATGYYLLPFDDCSTATLTTDPQEVGVKNEFTVTWSVPRASKNDRIEIYPLYGRSYISGVSNKEAATSGSTKLKAPAAPGAYEVRYYPAWLSGNHTGHRHGTIWAASHFTVSGN